MIEVEIKGHYGQYIKGFLRRIVDDKGVIVYADSITIEETIPLSELRLPPKESSESFALIPQQHVEALFPLKSKDDQRENGLAEAVANVKSQSSQNTSRLANPLACLTCPSWWPCVVTKVRDDHAVVQLHPILPEPGSGAPKEYTELAASLSNMTEICERKTLRQVSGDLPRLHKDSFFSHKIEIPPELRSFASDPVVHECLTKYCSGPFSTVTENDQFIILSPSEEVIRVASLLEEIHIRMLRQKWAIMRFISQSKRSNDPTFGSREGQLSSDANTWSSDENHWVECFHVPASLMGLVIGTQGSNIRAARNLAGVIRIDVREQLLSSHNGPNWTRNDDDDAEEERMTAFKIIAETREAAKAARALLEYCELCLLVPRRLLGRVLGSRTSNILSITEKSGVKHIYLEESSAKLPTKVDEVEPDSERAPSCLRVEDVHPHLATPFEHGIEGGFFIIGTRESVEKARLLITFQIDCIFDLEKLESEKLDLIRELPPRESRAHDSELRENGPANTTHGRAQSPHWLRKGRTGGSYPHNGPHGHYGPQGSGDPGEDGGSGVPVAGRASRGNGRGRGMHNDPGYHGRSRQQPLSAGDASDTYEGEQHLQPDHDAWKSSDTEGVASQPHPERHGGSQSNRRRAGGSNRSGGSRRGQSHRDDHATTNGLNEQSQINGEDAKPQVNGQLSEKLKPEHSLADGTTEPQMKESVGGDSLTSGTSKGKGQKSRAKK